MLPLFRKERCLLILKRVCLPIFKRACLLIVVALVSSERAYLSNKTLTGKPQLQEQSGSKAQTKDVKKQVIYLIVFLSMLCLLSSHFPLGSNHRDTYLQWRSYLKNVGGLDSANSTTKLKINAMLWDKLHVKLLFALAQGGPWPFEPCHSSTGAYLLVFPTMF